MKLSVTVTLKDNLDVNLYVRNISEDEASHYYIKWTFKTLENDDSEDLPGDAELQSVSQYSAETYKLVMASIFAYQMTRPFIINVYYDGTRIVEDFSYSVRDYLEAVINTESEYITEKDKDVSRKALDYGANAQLFFDGRTYYDKDGNQHTHFGDVEHLANENTNSTNEITATKPSNTVKKTGSVTGLSKMSVSLILGTEISIKIYFNYSGDMGQLSFYCDNKSLTEWVQEGENRYSVKVEGIRSYELYKDYTVTITDGTGTVALTYSPYAYAASNWNSTVEYLSNLVKALVAYGDAARNRWPN